MTYFLENKNTEQFGFTIEETDEGVFMCKDGVKICIYHKNKKDNQEGNNRYKAGNNIHIFDLEFRNEYQLEKEFSVQGTSPSLTDNFDKVKKPELTGKIRFKSGYNEALWVAKIISHRSLHLDEYVKLAKSDPVWREGFKSYFDPYLHDHVKKKYGLGNYLDRYREQCDVPL